MGYINKDSALELLGGSNKLFHKLLTSFYSKYADLDGSFEEMLSRNDFEEARRLAHSIKGLSGNLGAYELQEVSKSLEYAYRDQAPNHPAILNDFYRLFKEVVKEVKELIDEYDRSSHKRTSLVVEKVSNQDYDIKLNKLLEALHHFKYSEVKSMYTSIKGMAVPTNYHTDIIAVFDSIEHFDYQTASNQLEGMLKKHNG